MSLVKIGAVLALISCLYTILVSYFISGWLVKYTSPSYSFDDIPDLNGKICVITGANTGIGFITARELVKKGTHVIGTTRSLEKGNIAMTEINEYVKAVDNKGKIEFLQLDLTSLQNVKGFVESIAKTINKIDILVLNAGIMFTDWGLSADGIENQFATNHLGHFLLVKLVEPLLLKSDGARIVSVSSLAHHFTYSTGFNFKALTDPTAYNRFKSYGQSKLANILFANELAQRYSNTSITANSLHPGSIKTGLLNNVKDKIYLRTDIFRYLSNILEDTVLMDADSGALTQLYVATSPKLEGVTGKYFTPIGLQCNTSNYAKDLKLQLKLWEKSEELISTLLK